MVTRSIIEFDGESYHDLLVNGKLSQAQVAAAVAGDAAYAAQTADLTKFAAAIAHGESMDALLYAYDAPDAAAETPSC